MRTFSWLKENISLILFLLSLSLAVYFEGATRLIFLVASLGIMLLSKQEDVAICFLLQSFMCDNLVLLPSLSFGSVASGVLILKCVVFGEKGFLSNKSIAAILLVIVFQLFSIVIYENTLINVIRLAFNLFVLLYYSKYSVIFRKKGPILIPSLISITVMIACVIGLGRTLSPDEFGVIRFSGIWIDDNFCGMYCLIGILSSVYAVLFSRKALIFAIPSVLISLYMASLAMSRSFLFVIAIIAVITLLAYTRNKSVGLVPKLLFILLFVIGVYYVIVDVAFPIIETRGLVEGGREDFTNGRLSLSKDSLLAFFNNPIAWLIGAGTSNTEHFKYLNGFFPKMSHNTYVDIVVEFGIIVFVYVIVIVFKFLFKVLKSIKETLPYTMFFAIIVLCYMGTLTMGQYSILFIAFGMIYDFLKMPSEAFSTRMN